MEAEASLTKRLEQAKQQLSQPFAFQQRWLLIFLNGAYLLLAPLFVLSEKSSTGQFVPHIMLGYVYFFVWATNLFSALYNLFLLRGRKGVAVRGQVYPIQQESKLDIAARWGSLLSIMLLSSLNMLGFGNPANDSILTDFALGHSLIVLSAILLGRRVAFAWFVVVMAILVYTTLRIGYHYRYNYLTRQESAKYQQALTKEEPWALKRQQTLHQQGLNPPTVARYFHVWFIFILIAFLTSYFFTGISLNMIRVIPKVTENIASAIEAANQQELLIERDKKAQQELQMQLKQEALQSELNFLKSQVNPHFLYNTLHYLYTQSLEHSEALADCILKVSHLMRYSLRENTLFVGVEEEVTYLKDFIELHQLRHKNKLHIHFSVSGPTAHKFITPFILISLVENAFKHGKMTNKDFPVTINIICTYKSIDFYLHNQKNHRPEQESTYIGLVNIQRRLQLTYPNQHSFRIQQDQDSFTCWLSIQA